MANFSNIMCPVDFDEGSLLALDLAVEIAKKNDALLRLVHVARVPRPDMDVPLPFSPNPRWERVARKKLERLGAERVEGKVRYQIHVLSGSPDQDIVAEADRVNADLIVMGTHGRRGINHFVLGSVAESVLRAAKCPVLVTRMPK